VNPDRTTRQRRLLEVGEAGQAALARSAVRTAALDGCVVEIVYLNRAGVGRVAVSTLAEARPFAHHAAFHHAASRAVAWGAWRALTHVRGVLGLGRA
jgi:hypothetical protein